MENDVLSITSLVGMRQTLSQEDKIHDEVFNSHDYAAYNTPDITHDASYRKPDKEQYIFSTMGNALYTVYSNNMVLPIRPKDKLRFNESINRRLIPDQNRREAKGVYIVEYYRISSMVAFDPNFLSNIISYYDTTANIYPENIEIKNYIKDLLILNKTKDAFKYPHSVLRVVTYIPSEYILKYQHVYIPTADIVIGHGYVHSKIMHPNSPLFKETRLKTTSDVKNFIEIDIVDTPLGVDRYIKTGNKVIPLKAARDPERKDKAIMTIYKDNFPIEKVEANLDELEEKLGIFKTEDEAMTNGDLKLKNENTKLENERDRIAYERDKLCVERDRLEVDKNKLEIEKHKLEVDKQKLEVDKDRLEKELEKMKIEMEMLYAKQKHELQKYEIEKQMLDIKRQSSIETALIDIAKKRFEYFASIENHRLKKEMDVIKHNLDLEKAHRDLQTHLTKNNIDIKIMESKARTAKYSSALSLGRDLVNTVNMLSKFG